MVTRPLPDKNSALEPDNEKDGAASADDDRVAGGRTSPDEGAGVAGGRASSDRVSRRGLFLGGGEVCPLGSIESTTSPHVGTRPVASFIRTIWKRLGLGLGLGQGQGLTCLIVDVDPNLDLICVSGCVSVSECV